MLSLILVLLILAFIIKKFELQYLSEGVRKMQSEEQLKEILGEGLFEDCSSFYEEVFQRKSEYKIILTRRGFSLFKIFAPILKEKGIVNTYGKIITDQALDYYMDNVKEAVKNPKIPSSASVIIVDDIIIFGRTIKNIVERILSNIEEKYAENLRILCITWNSANTKILKDYGKLVIPRSYSSSLGWKKQSGLFSKVIKVTDIANTSYIISFQRALQENDAAKFIEKCNNSFFCNTTSELELNHVKSYVIKAYLKKGLFSFCNSPCGFIRVYYYEELNSILISPLLILDNVSVVTFNSISNEVAERYCRNLAGIKGILTSNVENLYSYKLRLLTLLLSHILLCDFLKSNEIKVYDDKDFDYKEVIEYNFSKELSDDFKQFNLSVLNSTDSLFDYCADGMYLSCQEFEDYVFEKAMQDNKLAYSNSEVRQDGFNIFNGESIFSSKYISILMTLLDNGIAALKTFFERDKGVSYIYPGEQAFRVMSNKFGHLLPTMHSIENISFLNGFNSYEYYEQFSELVFKKGIQTQDEHKAFVNYIKILKENGQQISDVMYIDISNQLIERQKKIKNLFNDFEKEVMSNDVTVC